VEKRISQAQVLIEPHFSAIGTHNPGAYWYKSAHTDILQMTHADMHGLKQQQLQHQRSLQGMQGMQAHAGSAGNAGAYSGVRIAAGNTGDGPASSSTYATKQHAAPTQQQLQQQQLLLLQVKNKKTCLSALGAPLT
jgi:hypothetical protein